MQWAEWAKPGLVQHLDRWDAASIPEAAAIICRNNAPLIKLAYKLLRAQRGVKLVGTDLGPQLTKAFKKLGPESLTQAQVLEAIDKWEAERLKKSKAKASISDKAECLRVFAGFGPTMSAAIAYVEKMFASGGSIQLLSGHKAKGLEYETVYHLDSWRIPSKWAESDEDFQQERNLEYVIATRSKENLYFINLEDMQ
jgi:superfamily I DNA/RNA helicase